MNSWSETISLPAPLRDACQSGFTPVFELAEVTLQNQWQAGYEKGRIDGEKSLSEQLIQQRAELHELFHGTIDSVRKTIPQVVRETENALIALALEVARKLVSEMPISAPMVEAAVRDALAQMEGSSQTTVKLNPADLELLLSTDSPLCVSAEESKEIRLVSSNDVTRGGCLVETSFGTVDARRETKFDLLKKNLNV
jgi:flagellar assembly protein FliH